MRLTAHFTKEEMQQSAKAAELGLDNICPSDLVPNMLRVATSLELVRSHFALPVSVLSCYRSLKVNAAVGGSKTSAHTKAMAADTRIEGVSVKALCLWCAANIPDFDQIIYEFGESGWMHIGFTSGTPRKQLLTATKVNGRTTYTPGIV